VFERVAGTGKAVETAIGRLPAPGSLDTIGLPIPNENLEQLLRVDADAWLAELPVVHKHFDKFGDRLPQGLRDELVSLEQRLQSAKVSATA
jgi:phosphoenolpyruvate carboxykinase (GTP)